jgi:uncharacterized protein YcfJ
MKRSTTLAAGIAALLFATSALAQVTFYEREGFRGRAFTTTKRIDDFNRFGFNDRASSVVVTRGTWEVCEHQRFGGSCVVLRPGSYDSLRRIGLNDRVSSMRAAGRGRQRAANYPEPLDRPNYDYYRRPNERVYEAEVTLVRAVMDNNGQHCWVEREQVRDRRGGANTGGAIVGAVIGGILGHQVGSGDGKTIATVGGAAVGGAIGANAGRNGRSSRDVEHCESVPGGDPQSWDVRYMFRGRQHDIQMDAPPGRTITVNAAGDPRQ